MCRYRVISGILLSLFIGNIYAQKSNPDTLLKYQEAFHALLLQQDVRGTILIYDPQKKSFYTNDNQRAKKGYLPASTFKIPNTIIALETSVVSSDSATLHWDGQARPMPIWEKDLSVSEAFQVSCVPCYQDIAGTIGTKRMKKYLAKLGYTDMDVRKKTIRNFWLNGRSHITCYQQIDFLERLQQRVLPLSNRTYSAMERIMKLDVSDGATLYGKTGWSTDKGNNGWFVGYVERADEVYYIAVNVEPIHAGALGKFISARLLIARQALQMLHIF